MSALLLLMLIACRAPNRGPEQPIPFDHSIHVRVQLAGEPMPCTTCHPGAEHGIRAGLPGLTTCLRCHMRPQGDPPGAHDQPVRVAAAQGGPFRFIQITHEPGHVYFAHGPHVALAGLACTDCHGDVASWKTPPTQPIERLVDMNRCLACHRERGAPTTCGTCHQ